eukprot:scaffold651208_cov29-Prasinocladus_malaysianus.AAC.1
MAFPGVNWADMGSTSPLPAPSSWALSFRQNSRGARQTRPDRVVSTASDLTELPDLTRTFTDCWL